MASVPCAAKWLNPADVVCGRWWGDELKGTYHRMPDRAQHDVRSAVWNLSKQSAGLSIKFHSNAPSIRVRYQVTDKLNMFHMPTTGVSGLDLYATDADGLLRWCASRFNLSFKDTINYEFRHITYFTGDRRGYDYELFLPLYNEVKWMEIGVDDDYTQQVMGCLNEAARDEEVLSKRIDEAVALCAKAKEGVEAVGIPSLADDEGGSVADELGSAKSAAARRWELMGEELALLQTEGEVSCSELWDADGKVVEATSDAGDLLEEAMAAAADL